MRRIGCMVGTMSKARFTSRPNINVGATEAITPRQYIITVRAQNSIREEKLYSRYLTRPQLDSNAKDFIPTNREIQVNKIHYHRHKIEILSCRSNGFSWVPCRFGCSRVWNVKTRTDPKTVAYIYGTLAAWLESCLKAKIDDVATRPSTEPHDEHAINICQFLTFRKELNCKHLKYTRIYCKHEHESEFVKLSKLYQWDS